MYSQYNNNTIKSKHEIFKNEENKTQVDRPQGCGTWAVGCGRWASVWDPLD
jgi:hypothetical protein